MGMFDVQCWKLICSSWIVFRLDRGDVRVECIEGSVVKLKLEGSCESCSSSTVTMKMGLERHLKRQIPEISDVVQIVPGSRPATTETIEEVLSEVRPFLSLTGGSVVLKSVHNDDRCVSITLHVDGLTAALQSVKLEIVYRLRKSFGPSIEVQWD